MTIGDRIKARRNELNMSVDELAAKLNKNRATIYRYESNYIENFPTTVLEPLAQALNTSPAYLMGWDEIENKMKENNISIYEVANELDIPDDILNKMIHEDSSIELMEKLKKIVEVFKLNKHTKEITENMQTNSLDDQLDGVDFALWGEVKELSDTEKQDVLDYIKFKKQQKSK